MITWLATTAEHHESLRLEFPSMRSIQLFGKPVTHWQVLPARSADFEEAALRACRRANWAKPAPGMLGGPAETHAPRRRFVGYRRNPSKTDISGIGYMRPRGSSGRCCARRWQGVGKPAGRIAPPGTATARFSARGRASPSSRDSVHTLCLRQHACRSPRDNHPVTSPARCAESPRALRPWRRTAVHPAPASHPVSAGADRPAATHGAAPPFFR